VTVPPLPPRFTLIALCFGGILFSWLSLEDSSVLPASLIGAGVAILMALRWVFVRFGGRTLAFSTALLGAILAGMVIGASAAVLTAALMLFKNGMHAHVFPDFPGGLILDMIVRAPAWAVAGALVGAGVALMINTSDQAAQSAEPVALANEADP